MRSGVYSPTPKIQGISKHTISFLLSGTQTVHTDLFVYSILYVVIAKFDHGILGEKIPPSLLMGGRFEIDGLSGLATFTVATVLTRWTSRSSDQIETLATRALIRD